MQNLSVCFLALPIGLDARPDNTSSFYWFFLFASAALFSDKISKKIVPLLSSSI